MNPPSFFGFTEEWQSFRERNSEFLTRYPNLDAAFNIAFASAVATSKPIERVVFVIGHQCREDFVEINILAANGLGSGAQKLLRGLYERAVTMIYLSEHPEEVHLFVNYAEVSLYKLVNAMYRTYGGELVPYERVDKLKKRYDEVKKDYEIPDCKKCGTTRTNYSWNRLDMVAMAGKVEVLSSLIVEAYLNPLGYAHSTMQALLAHVEKDSLGRMMSVKPGALREEADQALHIAHLIILAVLAAQKNFFRLQELSAPLETCFKDFDVIWARFKSAGSQETPG
jgi:hypothetical protein